MPIKQDTIEHFFFALMQIIVKEKKTWGDSENLANMIGLMENSKRMPINDEILYSELSKFFQAVYTNVRLGLLGGADVNKEELEKFFVLLNKHRSTNNLKLFSQKKVEEFIDSFYENFGTDEEIRERAAEKNSTKKKRKIVEEKKEEEEIDENKLILSPEQIQKLRRKYKK